MPHGFDVVPGVVTLRLEGVQGAIRGPGHQSAAEGDGLMTTAGRFFAVRSVVKEKLTRTTAPGL
jgi:hypothetical protein